MVIFLLWKYELFNKKLNAETATFLMTNELFIFFECIELYLSHFCSLFLEELQNEIAAENYEDDAIAEEVEAEAAAEKEAVGGFEKLKQDSNMVLKFPTFFVTQNLHNPQKTHKAQTVPSRVLEVTPDINLAPCHRHSGHVIFHKF
jgi:hypothetical protein